jgi:two-component system CheB/CheR fusion protein
VKAEGLRALAGVPLVLDGAVSGVLVVGSRSDRDFTDHDLRLLQMVADRAALAIDRAKLLDRERARRSQAEKASRFKTDLLNMAGHDLKSPMSAAKIQASRIQKLSDQPDKLAHSVQVMQKSLTKLELLLDDFLDLSRLEAGKFVLHIGPVDLAPLMADVLEAHEAEAQLKEIGLEGTCQNGLTVEGDERHLVQVLNNLVGNALRYTPSGGKVRVRGTKTEDEVDLEVQDTGAGLSPDQMKRLFRPYSQVHGTERLGSGLGLYLARTVAEQHGGRIEIESPGPDQGTTVRLFLPRR